MITATELIRSTQPHLTLRQGMVDGRDADHPSLREALLLLQNGRPNLLVIGSGMENEQVLDRIRPLLRIPVASWSPATKAHVPGVAFRTLVIRQVECLTSQQQRSLGARLRQSTDIQLVSMATTPLFPLVKEGRFLEELYYRLNVVLVESRVKTVGSAVQPLSAVSASASSAAGRRRSSTTPR